jgi:hypothetical protein
MEVIEQNTRETQRNHDDVLVLKTKFALAGLVTGIVSGAVSSIVVGVVLYWLRLK